jgi:hypothetical protein
MAHTVCLVCLVSTVSGCRKNTLRRASASRGHITNLSNLLFLDIYEGLSRVAVIVIIILNFANGNMTEMKQCIHPMEIVNSRKYS